MAKTPTLQPAAQLEHVSAANALLAIMQEPDDFSRYRDQLPDETKKRIDAQQRRLKHGLNASVILTCPGFDRCKFQSSCTIPTRHPSGRVDPGEARLYPIGQSCIVERSFYEDQLMAYNKTLSINANNAIERGMVQELASLDVMIRRAKLVIGAGDATGRGQDFTYVNQAFGEKDGAMQGAVIQHNIAQHPAVDAYTKFSARAAALRKEFAVTREQRIAYELKRGDQKQKKSESQRVLGIVEESIKRLREGTVIDVSEISQETRDALTIK